MREELLIGELRQQRRRFFRPRLRDSQVCEVAAPASTEQLDATDAALGFELPPLLRRIYVDLGNGGCGPGYGLIGCAGGSRDERGDTIVEAYRGRQERDPEDPSWLWPDRIVPLFSWGGAVYSCGDFSDERCWLSEFDPHRYRRGMALVETFRSHEVGLGEFLARWVCGKSVALD